ncbi:FAD-dependent monooxygenase [Methylocapsa sp. S129]|uniref:FAD-dependent monooxygenase n=1 Tax=Methylocapsa sp. S129 TaxID=1641869 RepID=UPI00131EB4BA|nr:FAD-dependent monooxygenase [Methylocapsa sp. S129]
MNGPEEAIRFDYDVLVVGAGPVGLSLAVELGLRNIRALVIEQNDRTGYQPRAKTTNVRSMEHMRRWGIAEAIRKAAPLPADYPYNIAFKTRLFGEKIALIENAFYGDRNVRNALFSEPAQWIPQYKVEEVLRQRAESLPSIELRFGCRFETLRESADDVTASIVDIASGKSAELRVRYVVGADGARSAVRRLIGAEMQGRHAMAQHVGLVIRAPELREAMERDPAIMYWLVNRDTAAIASPMDKGDLWAFGYSVGAGDTVDEAESQRRIAAAFGRPVVAEILSTDCWSAHSLIADHYGASRVFLIGDSCHLHPPFGGYGMNLGIADAVDLGWKLAATLHSWGGEKLLASYEIERRPVHRRVIEEAAANHSVLPQHLVTSDLESAGPDGDAARLRLGDRIHGEKSREFHTLGVVLGYAYSGSPLVVPDASVPPPEHHTTYTPSAHPGCLAPHLWLEDGRSLYDLFGPEYTLLATRAGAEDDAERLAVAAHARRMPLKVARPEADGLADLYGARFALIRPDQHVAWRGDRLERDAGEILDIARGANLG